jgi:hypothetical protein
MNITYRYVSEESVPKFSFIVTTEEVAVGIAVTGIVLSCPYIDTRLF